MSDVKKMREELRRLRKENLKPVSRMKKGDISAEIEKLKVGRAETPAAAAVPSAPMKKSKAAVETIKEAKAAEFPIMPASENPGKKAMPKKAAAAEPKKKSSKLAKLMKMMEAMSSDEEE